MKWVLALGLIFALSRFCHTQTDGFRVSKIRDNTFVGQAASESLPPDILAEPFTYLARGKESFVFIARDGKTVLKLLNNRRHALVQLFQHLPFCEKKCLKLSQKIEKVLASYLLAKTRLEQETGLLFLHLHETHHLKHKVRIQDKLGIVHDVDLDKTAFILQKKAELAYPQLQAWIQQKDLDRARQGILSLVDLLKQRHAKKIQDKDPLIRTNIGFLEGNAVFLDLGAFSHGESPPQEIPKILHSLKLWLEKQDPSLALFLEEELRNSFF